MLSAVLVLLGLIRGDIKRNGSGKTVLAEAQFPGSFSSTALSDQDLQESGHRALPRHAA